MPDRDRKSVLIVEDDETIRNVVKEFLEIEEYVVYTATNGREALDVLDKVGLPALILLDMKMPVMNGWQFALEFINRHDHKIPIVVMTAAADAKERASDITAIGWIGKPFDLNELLAVVKRYQRG